MAQPEASHPVQHDHAGTPHRPIKISILVSDCSNNGLSRAVTLAHALSQSHTVELLGPATDGDIWFPLRHTSIPITTFRWRRFPLFFNTIRQMLAQIDGDIIVACKPRITSFGVGLLKKWGSGTPLIVDIDDWELGFYHRSGIWQQCKTIIQGLDLSRPSSLPYLWLMERLLNAADAITVSNAFLQQRYSGFVLHHCRDTTILNPTRFDSDSAKISLSLSGKYVVMFLGTPREHKGLNDLLNAMQRITNPDIQLVIVGAEKHDTHLETATRQLGGRATILPKIPYNEVARHVAAADVVVIPQHRSSQTRGQTPAKLFDAMAMAKPIIATTVSDIPEVLHDCGYLVEPGNVQQLAETIEYVCTHKEEATQKGKRARERCQELYDMTVLGKKIDEVCQQLV